MIPSSLTAARGFVLRKVRGVFDACRLLVTASGHRLRSTGGGQASLLQTSVAFAALMLPVLAVLLLVAVLTLAPHHAALALPVAFGPTIEAKNPKVGELLTKAAALEAEIADESKPMTGEELKTKADAARSFRARAAHVLEQTPQDEIDRQGGDEALRRSNPDSDAADKDTLDFAGEIEKLAIKVRKAFGGPNGYLLAMAKASAPGISGAPLTDKRLKLHQEIQALQKRAIIGDSGDVSGGEFLLPLQQVQSIFSAPFSQLGIVDHALRFPVSGRSLRIPMLDQYTLKRTDGTLVTRPQSGIANVGYIGEGVQKDEREPSFVQRLLTIYKVAAYSEIGDETLGDDLTGQLAPTVQRSVGGQVLNFINEQATIDGSGTSSITGALYPWDNNTPVVVGNGSLLTLQRQTKGTITITDVLNMFAQHTFGGGQSFWLIHRTALPKILALTFGSNTLITFLKDLQGAPQMQMLGLPIYVTDLVSVLGSKGDISLCNGGFYALAMRQALTVESSIHYKFRNDLTAYRFVARAGGIPIPTAPFGYKAVGTGSANKPMTLIGSHSPFVQLDHAATGS